MGFAEFFGQQGTNDLASSIQGLGQSVVQEAATRPARQQQANLLEQARRQEEIERWMKTQNIQRAQQTAEAQLERAEEDQAFQNYDRLRSIARDHYSALGDVPEGDPGPSFPENSPLPSGISLDSVRGIERALHLKRQMKEADEQRVKRDADAEARRKRDVDEARKEEDQNFQKQSFLNNVERHEWWRSHRDDERRSGRDPQMVREKAVANVRSQLLRQNDPMGFGLVVPEPTEEQIQREIALLTGGGAPPAIAAPTARISSDAQYNALPSGAQFIGPDGAVRRKP